MTEAERKLIEDLELNHEYCPKEVILQAAALLRKQAAEIERLREALNAVYIECDWYGDNGRDAMEKAGKLLRGEA